MSFAVHGGDKRGAEHMGANLLPRNAAVRCKPGHWKGGVEKRVGMIMAKVIEFYIPNNFRKRVIWTPPEQRGKSNRVLPTGKEVGLSCEVLCNRPLRGVTND